MSKLENEAIPGNIARLTIQNKLTLLRTQHSKVHDAYDRAHSTSENNLESLEKKRDLLKSLPMKHSAHTREELKAVKSFLRLARLDHDAYDHLLPVWHQRVDQLWTRLTNQSDAAFQFCDVLKEWLDTDGAVRESGSPSSSEKEVVEVPVQRAFNAEFDFEDFLRRHQFSENAFKRLENIQKATKEFGKDLLKGTIFPKDVARTMEALAGDPSFLSPDARRQILEEKGKDFVLSELASAFNGFLRNLTDFSWPKEGVRRIFRTHLNGKKRGFLDMDIVNRIFIELIGQTWVDHFTRNFKEFQCSKDWPKHSITSDMIAFNVSENDRYIYCLATRRQRSAKGSLEVDLENRQIDHFMGILNGKSYGDSFNDRDGDALSNGQGWSAAPWDAKPAATYRTSVGVDNAQGWEEAPSTAKPAIAYLTPFKYISTDIRLCGQVDPDRDLTFVHTDLETFGDSIPHAICLQVMKFLHMSQEWLDWIAVYLTPPLVDSQGRRLPTKTVGTPFNLIMSSLLGEMTLVMLDAALAFDAGIGILRNHDDFWFWSQDQKKVCRAWEIMQSFAKECGLAWNMEKTGTCVVSYKKPHQPVPVPASLPQGPFRCGLLVLQSDGTWTVEEKLIQRLMDDVRREMSVCRSFLGKVNVWNRYQGFAARNLAPGVVANGRAHTQMLQKVFASLERKLDIWQTFRKQLPFTYGLPDGAMLYPSDLGGFHIHSQLIVMFAYEDRLPKLKGDDPLETQRKATEAAYKTAVEYWTANDEAADQEWHRLSYTDSWVKKQTCRPKMIDSRTFSFMHAAHCSSWLGVHDTMMRNVVVTGDQYANLVKRLHGGELRRLLGRTDCIVPADEVPRYALVDLKQTARQRFS